MPEVLRGVWTKGKLDLAANMLCHGAKRLLMSKALMAQPEMSGNVEYHLDQDEQQISWTGERHF